MARDPNIDARLQRWAEWLTVGDGSGYPVKSTLHEDWSPPGPGITPSMKVAPANDARQTHRLVQQLGPKQQAVVVVHYIKRLPAALASIELQCRVDTVHARIEAAHAALRLLIDAERRGFCNIQ